MSNDEDKELLEKTLDNLKSAYKFLVNIGGKERRKTIKDQTFDDPRFNAVVAELSNPVFNIASSISQKHLNAEYLERDERLWFDNIEKIYKGEFGREKLYFYRPNGSSCFVNLTLFKNVNLRTHLLLYDTIYCVLPLEKGKEKYEIEKGGMEWFLKDQKLSRDDLLYLVERDRLKFINLQPESRLDFGFLNEVHATNPSAVISRRAIAALCAIDLVELNRSYPFSDPAIQPMLKPLTDELSRLTNRPAETIAQFLLWPKSALRTSFVTLNRAGPMGIASYGINNPIEKSIVHDKKEELDFGFEFSMHSDTIHVAHALDATYFPFYVEQGNYTDYPYMLMMGELLNSYRSMDYKSLAESVHVQERRKTGNPTMDLISIFEINDYMPIREFEGPVSSSIVRDGLCSLFSELSALDESDRNAKIAEYNLSIEDFMGKKSRERAWLNLAKDTAGLWVPFLGTGERLFNLSKDKSRNKFPAIRDLSEYMEKRLLDRSPGPPITLLSKINRVARLRKRYN